MTEVTADDLVVAAVNGALRVWRQGDCVVGEQWFVHAFFPDAPLTPESRRAKDSGTTLVESEVRGLVVLTQSCDIVRDCKTKPFVEVCPLVEVDAETVHDVKRLRRPNYALVPGTAGRFLVADLDRTMTVEKSVVAAWARTEGCRTDQERALFAWALARKRSRIAFPDDFNEWLEPLRKRIAEKHEKQSPEGRALAALLQIRVRGAPDWNAQRVELTFYFVIGEETPTVVEGKPWSGWVSRWLALVPASGRFSREGVVATLPDLTARDYVESDLLDLDYLSKR